MNNVLLPEMSHIVNVIPPIDITGGVTGDVFSLDGYKRATIVVQVGVSAAAFTKILVNECSDLAGSNPVAIPYTLYKQETASGDVLGSSSEVTAAGQTPSANDDIFYVIELDENDFTDGKHFVQLSLTNTSNSVIASAVAILHDPRASQERHRDVYCVIQYERRRLDRRRSQAPQEAWTVNRDLPPEMTHRHQGEGGGRISETSGTAHRVCKCAYFTAKLDF